jgi:hypothetical protein
MRNIVRGEARRDTKGQPKILIRQLLWYNYRDTGFRTAGIFWSSSVPEVAEESPERPPRQGKEEFVVERYGNVAIFYSPGE